MSFEFAYARTADFERGWANDPNDPGGKTMHGVTESTWLDYWRRRGTVPPRPIEQATSSQAKIVLNDDYWTRTFSQAAACLTRLIGDPCHAHSLHLRAAAPPDNQCRHAGFYFDEFCFRYNNRKKDLFNIVLSQSILKQEGVANHA